MIPQKYKDAKYEDVPEKIRSAFSNMVAGGKGFYIHGSVGTGKTHICYAIAKRYLEPSSGRFIEVKNVVDLIHEIRQDIDRQPGDKQYPEESIMRTGGILVLDDIGAERATGFVAETIYRIVNERYVNNKPTIFTSNCTIQELAERIGDRTASRIVEMCDIYQLTGGDRRTQSNAK